jgi:thioredoxin reductase
MMVYDVLVIGGGPGGLGAAINAAQAGAEVLLLDENHVLGGQLFKQIHKFFGSKEHYAGSRGIDIGQYLLKEAKEAGVNIKLNSKVVGCLEGGIISVYQEQTKKLLSYEGKKIILAVGAKENAINFPGWTLPGVMTAGAAQTFANVHGVLPGKKILMVGSGNVGLIVSYQLTQAGAKIIGIIDALPKISGYGVHAAKVSRMGVPFYLNHTISRVMGEQHVQIAEIVEVNDSFQPIPGTEKQFEVDTVLLAVGLSPKVELASMLGCAVDYDPRLGGHIVLHDDNMESTVKGVYVCGDSAGVEEASTALEEGRLAGIAAAQSLGYVKDLEALQIKKEIWNRLEELRKGPFGKIRREAKEDLINGFNKKAGREVV